LRIWVRQSAEQDAIYHTKNRRCARNSQRQRYHRNGREAWAFAQLPQREPKIL